MNSQTTAKPQAASCRRGISQKAEHFRILREEEKIYEGALDSLRRFKDEVEEVRSGQECGLRFAAFQELREGDFVECFEIRESERKL